MKKGLSICLAALLAFSLLVGCSNKNADPVPVQSVGLITGVGALGRNNRFAGMVTSGDTVNVEKNEEMAVAELLVAVGDTVQAGDVLFVYDMEALQLSYDRQKLELEQLQNTLTAKTEQIAQLEKEKAKAPSSQQLDYSLQIQSLQIDQMETQISITAKEKELSRSEAALNDSEVRAPSDGRIQAVNPDGGTDNNGNPLPYITLAQTDEYRVKATLNEQNRGALSEGARVTVYSRIDDNRWYGTVTYIDWENPQNGNSGGAYYYDGGYDEMTSASKYPFYVQLDDSEGLLLGQHVYLEAGEGGETDETALMLPAWYVEEPEGIAPYVWAATKKDTLEKRPVTIGDLDVDTQCYPILSGLTPEDYIAMPGEDCAPGRPVTRYDENDFSNQGDGGWIDEGGYVDDGGWVDDGGYVDDGGWVDEGAEDGDAVYEGAVVGDGEEGGVG